MNHATNGTLAVITGASSGIGYELARQFAQNGFDLLIASGSERINEAQQSLASTGVQVHAVQADLASYEGVEKFYQAIKATGRPIDAIAINAGVGVGGEFTHTDLQAELNLIQLNVVGPVHLAKLVLKDMIAAGKGRVLFTSSIAGTMPAPFEAVYGASKAFLTSFAQAIRNELKDAPITITVLMPGATETDFFHRAGMDDTKVGSDKKDDAADVARDGFEALMAGKDHVVAGSFKNKVFAVGGHALPDPAVAEIHRGMAEPGSGKK